jgi:hypothetical protein
MTDPLAITAMGSVALAEGIKFLYGQAAALLAANRERRSRRREEASAPDTVVMPDITSPQLDAPLRAPRADLIVVDAEQERLAGLTAALSLYALDQIEVPADDRALRAQGGELRALLEAVYGQRITFKDEPREPTGTRVVIEQRLGRHEGEATGLEADSVEHGADIEITQSATSTNENSAIVGAKIKRIGGG